MNRKNLRRAVSGVLSVTMTFSALFADFTMPTSVFATEESDESSLDAYSDGNGSITSEYITENISDDMAEEAASLNEEAALVVAEEYLTAEGDLEDEVAAISDEVVSEEEIAAAAEEIIENADDILTAEDYDGNGVAASYHYITLNYALVDADAVWSGMTISDVWEYTPDSFIASFVTNVNVYTLEDNEDYYVAFADPGILNGMGSGIYADFTDDDTFNPTIYNDIISFDAETGLIYIPKSFYYNEEGEEVLKTLVAEILVPYDFDDDTTSLSVTVDSKISGVEGISGTVEVAALDVTVTVPIVSAEDADKISIEDIRVTVNDDPYPFDMTDGNGYYDSTTGELTIAVSGNTVYSMNVTIAEDSEEETLALVSEKEILVASVGDLSNIIVADTSFYGNVYYATDVASMKSLPKGSLSISGTNIKRGQEYTYDGYYQYINNYSSSNTDDVSKVITNTAPYCYYYISEGNGTAVDLTNYGGVNADGSVYNNNVSSGSTVLCNTSSPDHLFNRIAELPSDALTSTDGVGTAKWSASISGNPTGYESYVALHCAGNATEVQSSSISGKDTLVIYILYASSDYVVFALNSPFNSSQSGSSVYKVSITDEKYYAKLGVEKIDSTDSSTDIAYAVYAISDSLTSLNTLASKTYASSSVAKNAANSTEGVTALSTSSSGAAYFTDVLEWDSSEGQTKNFYIMEIYSPSTYEKETGFYTVTVKGTTDQNGLAATITSIKTTNISGSGYNSYVNNSTAGSYIKVADVPAVLYGQISITKVNSENSSVKLSGVTYGVYSDSSCTNLITSITTNASGVATYTTEWNSSEGTTETVYIKETSTISPYILDTTVYKAVITGSTSGASSSTCTVTAGGSTEGITHMFYNADGTPHTIERLDKGKYEERIRQVSVERLEGEEG